MAGPSSTSNLTVETVFKMSSFSWDPLNSADWDKEKARPDCILRIKRYLILNLLSIFREYGSERQIQSGKLIFCSPDVSSSFPNEKCFRLSVGFIYICTPN